MPCVGKIIIPYAFPFTVQSSKNTHPKDEIFEAVAEYFSEHGVTVSELKQRYRFYYPFSYFHPLLQIHHDFKVIHKILTIVHSIVHSSENL